MDRIARLFRILIILLVIGAGHDARADWRFYENQGFALDASFAGGFEFSAAPGA